MTDLDPLGPMLFAMRSNGGYGRMKTSLEDVGATHLTFPAFTCDLCWYNEADVLKVL